MTFPEPGNFTGIADWFDYANTVTDNNFSILILGGLYFIVFLYMKTDDSKNMADVTMYSGFFTMLIAIVMWLGGFLSTSNTIFLFLGMVVISFAWSWLSRD